MKRIYTIFILVYCFVACTEWEPVTTFAYRDYKVEESAKIEVNKSIAELKAMYKKGTALNINEEIVIKGQVISSDKDGNFYKSLYIQDESGAIELKIGKTGLYNEYKLGQWLFVKCCGLTLGGDKGMIQLGYKSDEVQYETAYMDLSSIIDEHILKGERAEMPEALELSGESLKDEKNLGRYVRIPNLRYSKKIFAIINYSETKSKDERVFLSNNNYGIDTWALSKPHLLELLNAGNFDNVRNMDKNVKRTIIENMSIVSVFPFNQYFSSDGVEIGVNTSSFARFVDTKIPEEVADGSKSLSLSGILTTYDGKLQFVLIDASDKYVKTNQ